MKAAMGEQVSRHAQVSEGVENQTSAEHQVAEAPAVAGSDMDERKVDPNPGEPHAERPSAEEPTSAIRGGCSEDAEGVWRHPKQPEQASWTAMTTDDPQALAAWQRAAWPGIGGIKWEGARGVFRDFNEPSTVFAPDEAFFAEPCLIDEVAGTYDPSWATRPRDEMETQRRFFSLDGDFVDWPRERERIFGKPPRRRDDAKWRRPEGAPADARAPWEEYKAKVTRAGNLLDSRLHRYRQC